MQFKEKDVAWCVNGESSQILNLISLSHPCIEDILREMPTVVSGVQLSANANAVADRWGVICCQCHLGRPK